MYIFVEWEINLVYFGTTFSKTVKVSPGLFYDVSIQNWIPILITLHGIFLDPNNVNVFLIQAVLNALSLAFSISLSVRV